MGIILFAILLALGSVVALLLLAYIGILLYFHFFRWNAVIDDSVWNQLPHIVDLKNANYKFVETNGIKLNVLEAGPKDGELLVLLHGFPENATLSWSHMIFPLIDAGYHVIAPDMRGYNKSDKPTRTCDYAIDVLAADVIGLLDYFKTEKGIIIGHDWGAVVAWRVAMLFPQRVKKLCVMNAPHPTVMAHYLVTHLKQLSKSLYILYFQLPFLPELKLSKNNHLALLAALQSASTTGKTFLKDLIPKYIQSWSEPGALTGMINYYRAIRNKGKRVSPRITVPTLILWGKNDTAFENEMANLSKNLCNVATLIFIEAGHFVQHDAPELVLSYLNNFVTKNESIGCPSIILDVSKN